MNVLVIGAAVAELVDQGSIRVKVENDWLVGGKQGIEVAVRKPVRVLGLGQQAEQIDDVDQANLKIREPLLQNFNSRQ